MLNRLNSDNNWTESIGSGVIFSKIRRFFNFHTDIAFCFPWNILFRYAFNTDISEPIVKQAGGLGVAVKRWLRLNMCQIPMVDIVAQVWCDLPSHWWPEGRARWQDAPSWSWGCCWQVGSSPAPWKSTPSSCAQGHSDTAVPNHWEKGEGFSCWLSGECSKEPNCVNLENFPGGHGKVASRWHLQSFKSRGNFVWGGPSQS